MMNRMIAILVPLVLGQSFLAAFPVSAQAQQVRARMSSREAYVGAPLSLQIQITNPDEYTFPATPDIDGCEVRTGGPTGSSSQVTIINGRRSVRRTVTQQYVIIPRRPGSFQTPEMKVFVDGEVHVIQPIEFVAVKSETGDLLFAEISGKQSQVYVGQPLELTLKIWVRPFRDTEHRVELGEDQMWQLLSNRTSWGSFEGRLQEMAQQNQRPAGKRVLRDNGQGEQREYLLYEITAQTYPTRPGKIDGSDVQIVLNYPTKIGKARDPFAEMFERNSRMKNFFDDEIFESPFSRLTITESRPIVADANVDSTEVVPVPLAGRPDDYRGAVGNYQIVTEAEPVAVAAGDPITLRIGIMGDGPMELVQAPPLAELDVLSNDFKVDDRSLAGFVQDDTKVFQTTIRPRQERVSQIPPIPFSFFDPATESYQTVYSSPIPIDVSQAETLSLDSIVSSRGASDASPEVGTPHSSSSSLPDFSNQRELDLKSATSAPTSGRQWWWFGLVVPPMIWAATLLANLAGWIFRQGNRFRSPLAQGRQQLQNARTREQLADAMVNLIDQVFDPSATTRHQAVGSLRATGFYKLGQRVERWFSQLDDVAWHSSEQPSLEQQRQQGLDLLGELQRELENHRQRPPQRSTHRLARGHGLWLGFCLSLFFGSVVSGTTVADSPDDSRLNLEQARMLLLEADELYQRGQQTQQDQPADAKQWFSLAADKYRQVVESGYVNEDLLVNLGNADWQAGELGLAVADYRRALRLKPTHQQASHNLHLLREKLDLNDGDALSAGTISAAREFSQSVLQTLGYQILEITLIIASVAFWGLLIIPRLGFHWPVYRWLAIPGIVLLFCSLVLVVDHRNQQRDLGIVRTAEVQLREGDGDEFAVAHTLDSATGQEVEILGQRDGWLEIKTQQGQSGWLKQSQIALLQ